VQGMLELANVPFVGAGVLGSALCMDKLKAKDVLAAHGLPQVPWIGLRDTEAADALDLVAHAQLRYPLFVKPANLGSSVGVSRATDEAALQEAVALAATYDEWIVVEESAHGREIEVAVLGNAEPKASVPGEVIPAHEFYDYEDKYLDGAAELVIPADLPDGVAEEIRALAATVFTTLRCDGMARVDFFYEETGRGVLVNEVNTIPGFTPISMYPKLWAASGVPYDQLIDELVALALDRHDRRARLSTKR
jgi:D-alanine--D-alanine ligase